MTVAHQLNQEAILLQQFNTQHEVVNELYGSSNF